MKLTPNSASPLATAAAPDNPTPAFHLMMSTGYDLPDRGLQASSDYLAIPTHGRAITHLDALCHMFWRGRMYNGYPSTEVKANGTTKCGIDTSFGGIVGRGVLLDIPMAKGVEWLEKGVKIFPLTSSRREASVRVEGDILAVRRRHDIRPRQLESLGRGPGRAGSGLPAVAARARRRGAGGRRGQRRDADGLLRRVFGAIHAGAV
jgi:hypothetical protein